MRTPHRTIGLVDMLAARPTRAHRLIVDILLPEVADRFRLWRQSYTYEPVAPFVGWAKRTGADPLVGADARRGKG